MSGTGYPHKLITEEQKLYIIDLVYRIDQTGLSEPLKEYAAGAALWALGERVPQRAEAKLLIRALTSLLTITAKGAAA